MFEQLMKQNTLNKLMIRQDPQLGVSPSMGLNLGSNRSAQIQALLSQVNSTLTESDIPIDFDTLKSSELVNSDALSEIATNVNFFLLINKYNKAFKEEVMKQVRLPTK